MLALARVWNSRHSRIYTSSNRLKAFDVVVLSDSFLRINNKEYFLEWWGELLIAPHDDLMIHLQFFSSQRLIFINMHKLFVTIFIIKTKFNFDRVAFQIFQNLCRTYEYVHCTDRRFWDAHKIDFRRKLLPSIFSLPEFPPTFSRPTVRLSVCLSICPSHPQEIISSAACIAYSIHLL